MVTKYTLLIQPNHGLSAYIRRCKSKKMADITRTIETPNSILVRSCLQCELLCRICSVVLDVHHHVQSFNVILCVAHQVVMAVAVSVEPFDALFSAISTRTYCFHDLCVFICDGVELWGDGFCWETATHNRS